jgi:excisionase family DNA binding protein
MEPQPHDADPLLTPAQVAALLYVDPKTVTRWARAGKLNSFRTPGGHRRFLQSDILEVMTGANNGKSVAPGLSSREGASAVTPAAAQESTTRSSDETAIAQDESGGAAVVAEAVAIALEPQVEEAATAVILTAAAAVTAARTAAEAAPAARALAARVAAEAVASHAAQTAAAIRLQADAAAVRLTKAASRVSALAAVGSTPSSDREVAQATLRLAAAVKAAAVSTADVAVTVSAAATAVENEVAKVAATLPSLATASAHQLAAETDAHVSRAAGLGRETATTVALPPEARRYGESSPTSLVAGRLLETRTYQELRDVSMSRSESRSRRRRAAAHACPRCKQPWSVHATKHPSGGWVLACAFCSWWEVRHGFAPLAPASGGDQKHSLQAGSAGDRGIHGVRLYARERDLVGAVTGYVVDGWSAGEACVVIATPEHREALSRRLAPLGLVAARARGHLVIRDAAETLRLFMRRGSPDPALFDGTVGALVRKCADGAVGMRAFGEMVDVLSAEDNLVGALQLEELWTQLQRTVRFQLLCGYNSFALAPDHLAQVRAAHDHQLL